MRVLLRDLRFAMRALRRQPMFTAVIVATLALAIGATTALFSAVEGVLLRSLPYEHPARLVQILEASPELRNARGGGQTVPYWVFQQWRSGAHAFTDMAAYNGDSPVLTGLGAAQRVDTWRVTSNLFSLLGARPLLGRGFAPQEDSAGTEPVAVISYAFWSAQLGRDTNVLGRSVALDGTPVTIVGVMAPPFRFPIRSAGWKGPDAQMWRSMGPWLSGSAAPENLRDHANWVIGLLRPGVTAPQAQRDLDGTLPRIRELSSKYSWLPAVQSMREDIVGPVERPLWLMMGAVTFVLLIACANIANMLLARGVARQREIAVRTALGASPWRIAQQLLTESVALALVGGALGIVLAAWGVSALRSLASGELPRGDEIGMNAIVLLSAMALTVVTGVLFGIVPAVQAIRRSSVASLKDGSAGSGSGALRNRASDAFVVAQIGLTATLLVGAGLLGRSFLKLLSVDPGFDAAHVVTAQLTAPAGAETSATAMYALEGTLLEAVRRIPGVSSAAVSSGIPLASGSFGTVEAEGKAPGERPPVAHFTAVTPEFFRTFSIPLHAGRLLSDGGGMDGDAIVVNDALVHALFAGENPIGRRVSYHGERSGTIVGVVGDTRQFHIDEAALPAIYEPLARAPLSYYMRVSARTIGDPASIANAMRGALQRVEPALPIDKITTMRALVSESTARQRLYTSLLVLFGVTALAIASTGVYGVVSYTVSRRTRELGVRVALGAHARDVVKLIVVRELVLTALGVALGAVGAFATTRLLRGLLFEIQPIDPITLFGVALLLLSIAVLACVIPARRATRVDPMVVLRAE